MKILKKYPNTTFYLLGMFMGSILTILLGLVFISQIPVEPTEDKPKEMYICLDGCKNGAKQLVPVKELEEI